MGYDAGAFLVATFSVKSFGAVGDASADDTAAIQAAIDAAEALRDSTGEGACVLFPPGRYRLTAGVVVARAGITLRGSGVDATRLVFNPSADNLTMVAFDRGVTGPMSFNGISDMRLVSTGFTGVTKTALKTVDVGQFFAHRIVIGSWTGTGAGGDSVGWELRGREHISCLHSYINADRPVRIRENPYTSLPEQAGNHFFFKDGTWIGPTSQPSNPIIEVDGGLALDECHFQDLAWAGGTDGFRWVDGSSTAASNSLTFSRCRKEQSPDPDGYTILIDKSGGARLGDLVYDTGPLDLNMNGIFLRNITRATIRNVGYNGTGIAYNVDDVSELHLNNIGVPTPAGGASISMGSLVQKIGFGQNQSSAALLPQNSIWCAPASVRQNTVRLYEAEMYTLSSNFANGEVRSLLPAGDGQGRIVSKVELFGLGSAGTVVHAVIIDQAVATGPQFVVGPTGPVSLAGGTAASVNYINNGTNARIQNLLAAGETIDLVAVVWLR